MKYIKYILLAVLAIVVIGAAVVSYMFWADAGNPYDNPIDAKAIPQFSEVKLDFDHKFNSDKSLPVTASALIDIDNDGIDELFLGGGLTQQDGFFAFKDGGFVSIAEKVKLPTKENITSLGAASADFDNNGFSDLAVSREDGITIYYNTEGVFSPKKVEYEVYADASPLGLALGDIDKDGDIDIFVSNYIRKEQMKGQNNFDKHYGPANTMLINNGDNTFKDTTKESGLYYKHNTFMAVLIDIDGDSWLDLIIAQDTGEVRTYKNTGDGKFKVMPNPTTDKFAYPMGIAVGDYNNDGKVDFMFSNTGTTVPRFMATGNIENTELFNSGWIFFENKGDFKFEEVAEKVKIKNFEFSWGAVMADMNNDGLQDLIVAENYVAFPPHMLFKLPGRFLVQKEDQTFAATEDKSGVSNPYYGITPLVSDFNNDGYLDMVWVNISSPTRAFINKGGDSRFFKVRFNETAENIGAKVVLTTSSGKILTEDYIIGEGLVSDQSAVIHFGLGNEEIKSVKVIYTDGNEQELESPKANTTFELPKREAEESKEKNAPKETDSDKTVSNETDE